MVEFCSVDPRLLPTCYVPLVDFERARGHGRRGHRDGRRPPCWWPRAAHPAHSPSHVGLDPVWARAQEAGIAVRLPRRGTGDLIDPAYFRNGLPVPPDFHGGEENFRSVDYMGIPGPAGPDPGHMIFDGVLDRFPRCGSG